MPRTGGNTVVPGRTSLYGRGRPQVQIVRMAVPGRAALRAGTPVDTIGTHGRPRPCGSTGGDARRYNRYARPSPAVRLYGRGRP